jgi:hypothetical protein
MRVFVHPPAIDGDTIIFSWEQSAPNPFQHTNAFFFRYENINLEVLSNDLFVEMFLALQLKVFAGHGTDVEVVFPEPISPFSVAFWSAYHNAEHVNITPLAEHGPYSPWSTDCPASPKRPYGVLFGGGKDSTLATCLLSELYGNDAIILFQYVIPRQLGLKYARRMEDRQERLMLRPAREQLGVATQNAWTDYLAQQSKSNYQLRPHLELFTAGFLPACLTWGTSLLTTSFSWTTYALQKMRNNNRLFRFSNSRPEVLATQSSHYHKTLGIEMELTNINLFFTPYTTIRMLIERYRDVLPHITMCGSADVNVRWCHNCVKCVEYALHGLACDFIDRNFDYNFLFTRSDFINRAVEFIVSGAELSQDGNAPWRPFFGASGNYTADCHALARLNVDLVRHLLSRDGFSKLCLLKAAYGNTLFPYIEQIPASTIRLLNGVTAQQVAHLAAEHFDVVDGIEASGKIKGKTVEYDFDLRMPTKTALLPHLQNG